MSELDYLYSLFSRETLNSMTKSHKLAYKYCLAAIFINMIGGGGRILGQKQNYAIAEAVKALDRKRTNFDLLLKSISAHVHDSLKSHHFKTPYNTVLLDNIINFVRQRIVDIKQNNNTLFKAEEILNIIDLKSALKMPSIGSHHWIEFDFHTGLVPTLPEAIIFHDLKVHWNEFLRLDAVMKEERATLKSQKEHFEYYNLETTRETSYKLAASARVIIFLCVSFVESYLMNLFYTIKETDIEGKEQIKGILDQTRLEDEAIVKAIIFKLFPDFKPIIINIFKEYIKVNKFRNRYVHASPFFDASSNNSEMQPLLNVTADVVISSLQIAIDFVQTLDNLLPADLKLLFWWFDDDRIDFKKLQPLKLTNSKSRYMRIKYY